MWRHHLSFLPPWLPYFCILMSVILFIVWGLFYKDPTIPAPNMDINNDRPFVPMTIYQTRDPSFDYKEAMAKMNENQVPQDDATLVQLIRNYYIDLPSKQDYTLDDSNINHMEYSYSFTGYVDNKFPQRRPGFYVECRAHDGEEMSPTLFLERIRQWNGLLIEPDPVKYKNLRKKNRKAFTLNACIHHKPYPEMMTFTRATANGDQETYTAQCLPLYTILLAMKQVHVTLLSLSSECTSGNRKEYEILTSVGFSLINVTFFNFRMPHDHRSSTNEFMTKNNYDMAARVRTKNTNLFDYVYMVYEKDPNFWTWNRVIKFGTVFIILYAIGNYFAYRRLSRTKYFMLA